MKNLLLLLMLAVSQNLVQAQNGGPLPLDLPVGSRSVQSLEIEALSIYLIPSDSTDCGNAIRSTNVDSTMRQYYRGAQGKAHIQLAIIVKDPSVVDHIHIKAGRSPGSNHFIERSIPFATNIGATQNVDIEVVGPKTIVITARTRNNPLPIYLEAWLEDASGNLSAVKAVSLQ